MRPQIRCLLIILDLENVPWRNRSTPHPELALCVVLHRTSAAGTRLKDEIKIFGFSRYCLSSTFNYVLLHHCSRFRTFLYWDAARLTLPTIQRYEAATKKRCGGGWYVGLGSYQ